MQQWLARREWACRRNEEYGSLLDFVLWATFLISDHFAICVAASLCWRALHVWGGPGARPGQWWPGATPNQWLGGHWAAQWPRAGASQKLVLINTHWNSEDTNSKSEHACSEFHVALSLCWMAHFDCECWVPCVFKLEITMLSLIIQVWMNWADQVPLPLQPFC